jgi:GH25 family lysozyme M1 (1,4-beta-N-acetylmuramidase)
LAFYFYSQAITEAEAEEEAQFLLDEIKSCDISLPVVIDFEYPTKNGKNVGRLNDANLSKKEKTALINAFCNKVKAAGYTPGVYASSYVFKTHLNTKKLDEGIMIWVADYNGEVSYSVDYDFWQFSDKGKCKGVSSKYVDTNYWYTKAEKN